MNDMGDASYVIGIKIRKDRTHSVLGLSRRPISTWFWKDFGCKIVRQP